MNVRQTIFYILDHPRIGARGIPQCIDATQLLHAPLPQPRPSVRRADVSTAIPSGLPVPGVFSLLRTPNGYFHAPRRGHIHQGLDLASPENTPVHATAAGHVIGAEWHQGYGMTVLVDHGNGMTTRYAHLKNATVIVGQWVERGGLIGHVGDTGNARGFFHVHYEVLLRRVAVDPQGYA